MTKRTPSWTVALLALTAAVAACDRAASDAPPPVASPPAAEWARDTVATDPPLEVVAGGLETPWAMDFAPDGRLFVTERAGRIRVIEDGALRAAPWAAFDVGELSEAGLLGIAVAPDFEQSGTVYVFGTFIRSRTIRQPVRGLVGRVIRLTERDGIGVDAETIIDGLPSHQLHAGGALGFGPDGMLYLSIGDVFDQPSAQDPAAWSGAILRFRPDGSIPDDNPTPGSPVYAKGLRNVQAFVWHEESGDMLAIDHGPTGLVEEGGRTDADELNVIRAGGNYGWPEVIGRVDDPRFDAPIVEWTPAIAPAGLALYRGAAHPEWAGSAFVTGLRGQQLRRVGLQRGEDGRWTVAEEEILYQGELGRLRAVGVAPDGSLYVSTSNRDGRGRPAEGDDRVLRVLTNRRTR